MVFQKVQKNIYPSYEFDLFPCMFIIDQSRNTLQI